MECTTCPRCEGPMQLLQHDGNNMEAQLEAWREQQQPGSDLRLRVEKLVFPMDFREDEAGEDEEYED